MLKTLLSGAGSLVTGLVPGLGIALKVGPWVVIALLAAFAWYQHTELQRDAETIRADAATCAAERAADANKLTAAADAQIAAQRSALNAAQAALSQATQAAQVAGASIRQGIAVQATQAGQDGPLAPVFQSALAGLRAQFGGTP